MSILKRLVTYLAVFGIPPLVAVFGLNFGLLPPAWAAPVYVLAPLWMLVTKIGFGDWVRTGRFAAPRLPRSGREWIETARRRIFWGEGSIADLVGAACLAGGLAAGAVAPTPELAAAGLGVAFLGVFVVIAGRVLGRLIPRPAE